MNRTDLPRDIRKNQELKAKIEEQKSERYIACPACGSESLRARRDDGDFTCRKCGEQFTVML